MAIIKTAKYLVGAGITQSSNEKSRYLGYANVDEMLNAEGFVLTQPNSYKLCRTCFLGPRPGFPGCIKHIFLHHSATEMFKGTGNMIDIFNIRAKASSNRGIDGDGNIEIILEDKILAYCQGREGYYFNTSGLSVELIALGYVKNELLYDEKMGPIYKQGSTKIEESKTALAVDFNEKPKAYKGHERYASYTQAQVNATVKLIREWGQAYKIPFVFNQEQFNLMFPPKSKLTSKFLKKISSTKGVFTHNTVQGGKSDIYPDPLLVKTFKKEFAPGNSLDPAKLK